MLFMTTESSVMMETRWTETDVQQIAKRLNPIGFVSMEFMTKQTVPTLLAETEFLTTSAFLKELLSLNNVMTET